jgi:hypothetical protein
MFTKDLLATARALRATREDLGMAREPFDIMLCPLEPITPEAQAELEGAGAHHTMALPWTPSPWGRAPWVKEGEDHTRLEVKCKAMERFANQFGLS